MQNKTIAIFGEVLFDCFPDGLQVLGGAPFNVAWHLQAFRQSPLFISRVGDDHAGSQIRNAMQGWGMSVAGLQIDATHPTGIVSVSLHKGEPSYQIVDNQAYDFIESQAFPDPQPDILYHGSLALRHETCRQTLRSLKMRFQGKVFVDVNLRSPWWDKAMLENWLAEADWVKLNEQELQLLNPTPLSLESKMHAFLQQYQLSGLIVTRGSAGAVAVTTALDFIHVTPESQVTVVDTVGAGDAFSAVLLWGIQQNWTLPITLQRAQTFASALVGQRGATVDSLAFYQQFLEEWAL
ncbi:carbohydrate kinase [Methylomonas sp. AM2-LC]|uniref:carbohydrate kinase family protein n=1 Tax=Methylomonas sp. AM2-LC TaxID=3153301 RepID=UPI00326621EF